MQPQFACFLTFLPRFLNFCNDWKIFRPDLPLNFWIWNRRSSSLVSYKCHFRPHSNFMLPKSSKLLPFCSELSKHKKEHHLKPRQKPTNFFFNGCQYLHHHTCRRIWQMSRFHQLECHQDPLIWRRFSHLSPDPPLFKDDVPEVITEMLKNHCLSPLFQEYDWSK